MSETAKRTCELAGWLIFVASACFFLAATVRAGDVLSTAGSVLFLLACFVFLVPLVSSRRRRAVSRR